MKFILEQYETGYLQDFVKKLCFVVVLIVLSYPADAQRTYADITRGQNETVKLTQDSLGNQIPDYSYCGYRLTEKAIPTVNVSVFVPNQSEDATEVIQKAIDYVGDLKPDKNGFKGAVLLDKGVFNISGTLYMKSSGVVLRGSGTDDKGTVLLGKGLKREAMLRVLGKDDKKLGDTLAIEAEYVPLGSKTIQLKNTGNLKVGDEISIQRPLTEKWIQKLGMQDFGGETGWIGWKRDDFVIKSDRKISAIEGNKISFSVPLTITLDKNYGSSYVVPYAWSGQIEKVGIENLTMKSDYHQPNPKDEQHRWQAISMDNVKNAWVRQLNFKHFAGGAVALLKGTRQITVEDCKSIDPISEIAGFRRQTFYTEGQQTLFQRCYSERGYHDFSVGGYGTSGPNAFIQCESYMPYSYSGSIGSWATGILFDIVNIDGDALSLKNHGQDGRGIGWNAANCVIWESTASKVECFSPPTAENWAYGVWGQVAGNGIWKEVNSHIRPRSLFYALLKKRLDTIPVNPQVMEIGTEPSSSPTLEAAQELIEEAEHPLKTLADWIDEAKTRNTIPATQKNAKRIASIDVKKPTTEKIAPEDFEIINGWITANNKLVTGSSEVIPWWRGSLRPSDVNNARPHITRFVPGHRGLGYTDNLEQVVTYMEENNVAAIEHNYGLWYDRRMDDHERVRRYDADAWPPFYEQPFDRSGEGTAWDHLSKYDLTDYNAWYFDRLKRFADFAEVKGKMLVNQQYFQHNIIEAGAHWASSPWRPANNINNTGFPEPPPYAGDKRIFFSKQFYDVNHPVRRKLHEEFIQKSLENFKNNGNVIQLTSAEFTGPLHFMQFWLDVTKKFEENNTNKALIGLSATKDVQDAILKDAARNEVVDVIDIRYWYYKQDGNAYAPEGGKNLAPRQHARKMDTGKETSEQVYRAVNEYREKYPEKAVLYSTNGSPRFGWAALFGGASLAKIPPVNIPAFHTEIPKMTFPDRKEFNEDQVWILENPGNSYLMYLHEAKQATLDLSNSNGTFKEYWIDSETGAVQKETTFRGGEKQQVNSVANGNILFIVKI